MTLEELHALDPLALWASLSPERQASIVVPLLTSAFAEVCAECDGTDCGWHDRETAAGIAQATYQATWDAIDAAFPAILDGDLTALHALDIDMLDEAGKIRVKGVRGSRVVRQTSYYSQAVKVGGRDVEIGGFKNIGTEDAPVWEAWTVAQVDAERLRRHPEQFIGPPAPGPKLSFASVLSVDASHPATLHVDHSYDRAA